MSEKGSNDATLFEVEIKGTRPLLMHSTAAMLKPKSNKVKSTVHDPVEEAHDCLYFCDNGKIGVPGFALLSAMKKAAVNVKKAGAGKKTLKDYVFSGLRIEEEFIELPNQEYTIDLRPVVVQRSRIMRARPLFKDWMLKFKVSILDDQTWDAGIVRGLLEDAGKYQGLLDFRPLFGTFAVASMKNLDGKYVGKEVK